MILHCTFTAESDSESILKISQHLPKLWAIKYQVVFYETRCIRIYVVKFVAVQGSKLALTVSAKCLLLGYCDALSFNLYDLCFFVQCYTVHLIW